jgi:hypothetical protein
LTAFIGVLKNTILNFTPFRYPRPAPIFQLVTKRPCDAGNGSTGDRFRRACFGKLGENGRTRPDYGAIWPHLIKLTKYQYVIQKYAYFWGIDTPQVTLKAFVVQ